MPAGQRDKLTDLNITNAIHFTRYRLQCWLEPIWKTYECHGDRKALFEHTRRWKAEGDDQPWRIQFDGPNGWTTCASSHGADFMRFAEDR